MRLLRPRVFLPALFFLAFQPTTTMAASNGGAAIAINSPNLRVPVGSVVLPDSGSITVYVDARTGTEVMYAQRLDRHGHQLWASGGVLVRSDPGVNYPSLSVLSDGAGGCIVAWRENRGATGTDIVAQRVLANGTLGYAASGLVICNATGEQDEVTLVPGPAGFYYAVWRDRRAADVYDDIYAQRVSMAGVPQWAANGLAVNSVAHRGVGYTKVAASDMQNGLLVGWTDNTLIPVGQRLNSAGALQWTANGTSFGVFPDYTSRVAPDGVGGGWFIFSHNNYAPMIQHIQAAGAVAFAAAGVPIVNDQSLGFDFTPVRNTTGGCFIYGFFFAGYSANSIIRQEIDATGAQLRGADGEFLLSASEFGIADIGGAVGAAWLDVLTPENRHRLLVQRYALDGTALFPQPAVASRNEPNFRLLGARLAGSASGITVVSYADLRYTRPANTYNVQIFGQAFGATGSALWDDSELPILDSVKDAQGDQGGFVRVNWYSGCADLPAAAAVTGYRVWRALPTSAAAKIERAWRAMHVSETEGLFKFEGRQLLAHANVFWEMVGESPAAQLAAYARTVPTAMDSTSASPADASFMVEAYDDSSHVWFTGALTAHSVDNLAPPLVSPAAGYYSGGSTMLYWGGSPATDLCCYDVYRGYSPSFVASEANRIGTTADLTWNDVGAPAWYRIGARDIHGNRGPTALVLPSGTTAVEDAAPRVWRLSSTWRRAENRLVLAIDVPGADEGRVELFDVTGRRLWSAPFRTTTAQSLSLTVDGRAAALAPGVVFARMRSASGTQLTARALVIH